MHVAPNVVALVNRCDLMYSAKVSQDSIFVNLKILAQTIIFT